MSSSGSNQRRSVILSDLLIVVALAGLWRTHACGDGAAARIGLGMAALGYILDVPGELLTEASRRTGPSRRLAPNT